MSTRGNAVLRRPPPPPRRVRRRGGSLGELIFVRLFTLPHFAVGAFLLGQMVFLPVWVCFGVDSDRPIARAWSEQVSAKSGHRTARFVTSTAVSSTSSIWTCCRASTGARYVSDAARR